MATKYGNVTSSKGELYYGKEKRPINAWDFETTSAALDDMRRNSTGTQNWQTDYADIQALYHTQAAQARYEELLGAMGEAMGAMAEASSRVEPAAEPLKAAPEQYRASQSEVAKKQQLRSGLLSAFNRFGYGRSGRSQTPSLANKATVMGG